MSTQTITAVAGAAIGFAIAGPAGAQWGYMIGGLVGGAFAEGPNSQGPRLSDLAVQTATEGQPMPIDWGTVRHAGVVLWSTDLREHATESEVGGKGGPSATQTTYSYDVDLGVLITDGKIQGVRRIWANSRLIYDGRETADASAVMASSKLASQITIYLGSEDQLPDPTYEAAFGVGNCPAYRGKSVVVFKELQLAKFGNTIPSFSFEFVKQGGLNPYRRLALATLPQQWKTASLPGIGPVTVFSVGDVVRAGIASELGGATYVYDIDGHFIGTESRSSAESPWPAPHGEYPDIYRAIGRLWNGDALYYYGYYGRTIGAEVTLVTGGAGAMQQKDAAGGLPAGRLLFSACMSADGRHILSITQTVGLSGGVADKWHITAWDGRRASLVREGTFAEPMPADWLGPGSTAYGNMYAGMMESNLEYVWSAYGYDGSLTVLQIGADNVMRIVKVFRQDPDGVGIPAYWYPSIHADEGVCVTITGKYMAVHTRTPAVSATSVLLSDVVADVCTRAGLAPAEFDASLLTDRLHGYTLATQTSGRAALDPLRAWRPFDVSEQEGVLRFIPRGRSVDFEIPVADLAAREAGAAMPDPLTITTADETELPSAVSVVYPNVGTDYQSGAATARRDRRQVAGQAWPLVQQQQVSRLELPVAMSSADAARVADTLLWDAYTAARRVKFSVGLKWAAVSPAHVVRIVTDQATYLLRVEKITEAGLVREIEAVFCDAAAYVSQPTAAMSIGYQPDTLALAGPTRLELLDIPLLRDTDDGPGYIAAVGRYLAGWPGATLYASSDAGATWAAAQSFSNPATIGSAIDALGPWQGGNIPDESNAVTVQLPPGLELSGIAGPALLAGGNMALLGGELLQFRTATLVDAGRYQLTGLLRGRRGTEAAMSAHAVGERFVLLSGGVAGLATVPAQLSDIGVSRLYKPVTAGAALAGASTQAWAYTGNNLKPLSPVHINAGRDRAGHITITWVRRSRVDAEWRDYADAALGESVERYEVEIYIGSTLVATLTSTQQSVTWPIADQRAAEAGNPVFSFNVKVWQMSLSVGRGNPGSASITLPTAVII